MARALATIAVILLVGCGKQEPNRGTVSPTDPPNVAASPMPSIPVGENQIITPPIRPTRTMTNGDDPTKAMRLWDGAWFVDLESTANYTGNASGDPDDARMMAFMLRERDESIWRVDAGWKHGRKGDGDELITDCTPETTRIIDNDHVALKFNDKFWIVYKSADITDR